MAKYLTDMTKGSELGHIIRFALPMLAGNLFQQFYNIADSIIVGKYLGYNALAAVGATGSITFLFYNLCFGLATGAGILVSQSYGAGKHDSVKKYITNSAFVLFIFGIVISVLSVLGTPFLLRLLDTPESVFDTAVGYMRISCAGTVAVALYNWISAVMRSLGDSRTPLIFLVIASVINVGLDLLFVVGLGMGADGAAWATITAQGISAFGSIIFCLKKNPMFSFRKEELAIDMQAVKKTVTTGIPIALQNAMVSVSMIYLQKTANSFGDTVMAAYTATMRIEQLIQQPFSSLNAAIAAFSGQNKGAEKNDRIIKGYHKSMQAGMVFALVMLLIFLLFSHVAVGLFVEEAEVIEIGGFALKISAIFYGFLGTIHITRGLLNGTGDVKYSLINGLAEVVGRIGFATLFTTVIPLGYMAVWVTTCFTWLLTAVLSIIRYKGGKWKSL